jgi:hypothetical protein
VVAGLSSSPGHLFVVPITSRLANVDLALRDWQAAGLNVPCGIKYQLSTIEGRLVLNSSERCPSRTRPHSTPACARGWGSEPGSLGDAQPRPATVTTSGVPKTRLAGA